jgi:hypothetical protein
MEAESPHQSCPLKQMRRESSDPFILPACDYIYHCRRMRASLFQGRRKYFVMPLESDQWVATCRGASFEFRRQSAPDDAPAAVLFYNGDATDFALRVRDDEVMTVAFRKGTGAPARRCAARVVRGAGAPALELESAEPHATAAGRWALDLGGRTSLPSRKNCRLDLDDHTPVVYIRKSNKGELEIQTAEESIDQLCLFALGVGAFLCHLSK